MYYFGNTKVLRTNTKIANPLNFLLFMRQQYGLGEKTGLKLCYDLFFP